MSSNAESGARAKARTKKWLEEFGYLVADMEKVYWIQTPRGRLPVKRDQLGADLLAVLPAVGLRCPGPYPFTSEMVFVQVKSGVSARGGTFPSARRVFAAFPVTAVAQQAVVAWPPRARQPRIVVM